MSKTVYILGAGFSKCAGAPLQGDLLKKIFELKKYKGKNKLKILGLLNDFEVFLHKTLSLSEVNFSNLTLEDVFTPLDRCIADKLAFKNIPYYELLPVREKIYKLIIFALRDSIIEDDHNNLFPFVKYIINIAHSRIIEKEDRIAIITTNWDIILDNMLHRELKNFSKDHTKDDLYGVVDYCCHISSLDEDDHSIKPGLFALGKGGFNVKLIKLHGSMNWLHCPKCQRLYVKFYKSYGGGYVFHKHTCRHCTKNYSTNQSDTNKSQSVKSEKLVTNMIMPTFLKDLSSVQLKLSWYNAAIELSEADKLVFLGYSLPSADFEMRQLLSRMVRNDAKIEVVLWKTDNPANAPQEYRRLVAGYSYESFFCGRDISISYDGVKKYIDDNFLHLAQV